MLEKLKKDNFLLGMALGFFIPALVFSIVYLIDGYVSDSGVRMSYVQDSTKYLIGVFFNLILFRIYMINWKMDRTGRGILAMTFFLAIGYLVLFQFDIGKSILH